MNKRNTQNNQGDHLSPKEVFQLARTMPGFNKAIFVAVAGVVAVFLSFLFESTTWKIIVSLLGCIISYTGFDDISQVIAQIQNTPVDECREILNDSDKTID